MRTRDLLVAVFLLALCLAVWTWSRRRERFRELVEAHRRWMSSYKSIGAVIVGPEDDPLFQAQQRRWQMWRAHKEAADAYEAAEWRPWASVPVGLVELPRLPRGSRDDLHVPEDDGVVIPPAASTQREIEVEKPPIATP